MMEWFYILSNEEKMWLGAIIVVIILGAISGLREGRVLSKLEKKLDEEK